MANIKFLTANDLLKFVKAHGFGENRTTLTRYQAAGILTLPHQFTALDELHNDIPDIRVKYYHPISIIEFIVNSLLFKGCWLDINSSFHISRSTQLDIFTGRIACYADSVFLGEYDKKFIDCGIGSFGNFDYATDSNTFLQEPLVSKSVNCGRVDRDVIGKYNNNRININAFNDNVGQLLHCELIHDKKSDQSFEQLIPNTAIIGIHSSLLLEVLTHSLTYSVFHRPNNTKDYIAYQKMIYSRTFEQVVDDYLPAILKEINLKEFQFYFFVEIPEMDE